MRTVTVQLTSRGTGGIAVILVAGEKAGEAVGRLGVKSMEVGAMRRCLLCEGENELDDGLAVRVGEDRWELHVHGGVAVVEGVLGALQRAGVERVDTHSACKLGLLGEGIENEIAAALPAARTMTAVRLLTAQKARGLAGWAKTWGGWLGGKTAGDLWRLHSATQWLVTRSAALRYLLEPARVALIGRPNAGKSTLANALLGRPMSITSELAGTTRDWVGGLAILRAGNIDVPAWLVDTAGIRETADALEQESIARTHGQARQADVVVWVADASASSDTASLPPPFAQAGAIQRDALVCWNKTDLAQHPPGAAGIRVSALQRTGLEDLMAAILQRLDLRDVQDGEPFAFSARQAGILERLALCCDVNECARLLEELVSPAAGD